MTVHLLEDDREQFFVKAPDVPQENCDENLRQMLLENKANQAQSYDNGKKDHVQQEQEAWHVSKEVDIWNPDATGKAGVDNCNTKEDFTHTEMHSQASQLLSKVRHSWPLSFHKLSD